MSTATCRAAKQLDGGVDEMGELTEREFQILEMVARGLQNKIIAAALRLSEYTVKIHICTISSPNSALTTGPRQPPYSMIARVRFCDAMERARLQRLSQSSR